MHPMLLVIPSRNTRRMEMSKNINDLKENSMEKRENRWEKNNAKKRIHPNVNFY